MIHVSFLIGGAIVGVGLVLYVHHRLTTKSKSSTESASEPSESVEMSGDGEECCGMHITCERDSLSPVFSGEIVYFDDEELDDYRGRKSDEYNGEEIEQFREVLLTLLPDDIAPWARSIQQRGINLPDEVRDELFIIVNEARQQRINKDS